MVQYHICKVVGGWEVRRPDGSLWCVRDSEAEAQEFADAANSTLEMYKKREGEKDGA